MNTNEANRKKLNDLKKEFIQTGLDLLKEMEEQDITYIENYPDYLPNFDEFICDFMDVEF